MITLHLGHHQHALDKLSHRRIHFGYTMPCDSIGADPPQRRLLRLYINDETRVQLGIHALGLVEQFLVFIT